MSKYLNAACAAVDGEVEHTDTLFDDDARAQFKAKLESWGRRVQEVQGMRDEEIAEQKGGDA